MDKTHIWEFGLVIRPGKDIFGSGEEWAQNSIVYLIHVIIAKFGKDLYLCVVSLTHSWPNCWLLFVAVHSWHRYAVSQSPPLSWTRLPSHFFFFSVRKSQLLRTSLISLFSSVSGKRKPVAAFHPRSIKWEQCFSYRMGTLTSADSYQYNPGDNSRERQSKQLRSL